MKKQITLLFILLTTLQLSAQVNTFTLDFHFGNNDEAYSVIQNASGNYIICGYVYPGGNNFDPVIAEISPTGVILQSYTLTSATSEIFRSVVQTSDGGYFITGNVFTSVSDFNALILKLDGNFQPQFYRQITNNGINDNANRGFEIASGIYGVTGSFGLGGAVKPSYLVLDNNGNIVSQTYLGTNQFASPDYRGRYIGNGQVTMGHLTNAFSVLDSSGTIVKSFGSGLGIYSVDAQRLSNENFACLSLDNYGSMSGATTSFIIVDSTCTNIIASKKFALNGNDVQPSEFIEDSNGNIIIAGRFTGLSSGNENPFLVKLDSNGNTIWMKSYLPTGVTTARFNAIAPTSDGGYIICGAAGPFNAQHMFLMKLDSAGNAGNCNVLGVAFTQSTPSTNLQSTHPLYSTTVIGSSASATVTTTTLTSNVICLTTAIAENEASAVNTVYPVPATDYIYFKTEHNDFFNFRIFDMSGRCMLSGKTCSGKEVSIRSLLPGCYLISAIHENGKEFLQRKLIIE
ncbi:MAG: T9SS type A sorting domain-containing protein [Bacteroidia bacterium]